MDGDEPPSKRQRAATGGPDSVRPELPCARPARSTRHAPAFYNTPPPSRASQAAAAAPPPAGSGAPGDAAAANAQAAGQQLGAGSGPGDQQQQDGAGGAPPAAQHPAAAGGGYVPVPEVVPDNTYMSREGRHIERERAGELTARYITNDGSIESGRLLIGLKNVFSKVGSTCSAV